MRILLRRVCIETDFENEGIFLFKNFNDLRYSYKTYLSWPPGIILDFSPYEVVLLEFSGEFCHEEGKYSKF